MTVIQKLVYTNCGQRDRDHSGSLQEKHHDQTKTEQIHVGSLRCRAAVCSRPPALENQPEQYRPDWVVHFLQHERGRVTRSFCIGSLSPASGGLCPEPADRKSGKRHTVLPAFLSFGSHHRHQLSFISSFQTGPFPHRIQGKPSLPGALRRGSLRRRHSRTGCTSRQGRPLPFLP